jgi:hypothetical protein
MIRAIRRIRSYKDAEERAVEEVIRVAREIAMRVGARFVGETA